MTEVIRFQTSVLTTNALRGKQVPFSGNMAKSDCISQLQWAYLEVQVSKVYDIDFIMSVSYCILVLHIIVKF